MEHVLDNPAWNALTTGNQSLSNGNHEVKYFDKEVSPFAAFKENRSNNFVTLYELIPHNGPVLYVTPHELDIPNWWKILQFIPAVQMVYDDEVALADVEMELVTLTNKHVSQMLELTRLTKPGPFAERTIDFGHYRGIFDGDKLVAMAGQRLHAFEYAEVSAVCTHPDYLGRGYAKQLLLHQLHRIKAASGIPFLHVRADNERAIKVYESLGFRTRRKMYFYVLYKIKIQNQKAPDISIRGF